MKYSSKKSIGIVGALSISLVSAALLLFASSALAQLPPPPPPPPLKSPTPQNLVATPISTTQINLSWDAVTGDSWLLGYNIYRCAGAGCTPTVQVGTVNATTTTYSNTGLASGTYVYAVTAYDSFANSESDKSTSVTATTSARRYTITDFVTLVGQWLQNGTGLASDVNTDNAVNTRDLGIMMSFWN